MAASGLCKGNWPGTNTLMTIMHALCQMQKNVPE